ncbi:histidine-containing phosphotransfer protein 1-like isoform X2 [Prosopis cineraria]|uniref:histidine-containing phosphotransfer protein 1-like isoform X2 n=1 Tax=Prosopis cineraria TaxID=364024 RepID=UPI00240EA4FF|nr:histidine-containing phosphotransfer protein 1-like isoform X2 [Prosopis cineraria]
MTLPILRGLHQDYLDSLLDEGIINDQFNRIHSQRTEESDFVVKLVEAYFRDVEAILSDLSSHADESNVDLTKLSALPREIQDKSTSIGAELVKHACRELIQACDENHKRKFDRSLMWVQSEFSLTKTKLESYVRMERRIIRYVESKSQSSSSS